MTSAVLYRRLEIRVVHRRQWPLHQLVKESPKPYAADTDRSNDIKPMDNKRTVNCSWVADTWRWSDQVKHVHHSHHENEYRQRRKPSRLSLEILMKQNEKWKGK